MRFGFWHGAWLSLFISYDILWTALAVSIDCYITRYYPSYFKLQVCWRRSFTRITYLSKLIGVHSLAAFLQLELFWVYPPYFRSQMHDVVLATYPCK